MAGRPKPAAAAAADRVTGLATTRLDCGLVAAIDDVWSGDDSSSASLADIPLLQDDDVLFRTSALLHHRGPDGMHTSSGTLGGSDDGKGGEARWAMGHTRLAIVDPNNRFADMPFELEFASKRKKVKLAANGEIYNHEAVYADLVSEDDGGEGWTHPRVSGSDCEVIAHSFAKHGGPATAAKLDGMFAFVVFEEDTETGEVTAFAARDPVGIKPLYYGRTPGASDDADDGASGYVFSSELKALVGHVDPDSVVAIPPGHYWTPQEGLVCYYNPNWLRKDDHAPWEGKDHSVTDTDIKEAFTKAVQKRMMADVDYGFFLSGGVDSAVVSNILLPLYRREQEDLMKAGKIDKFRKIPTFTVGMENARTSWPPRPWWRRWAAMSTSTTTSGPSPPTRSSIPSPRSFTTWKPTRPN